jgi:serine-type D-Ala-D-Ala carboxypeptidase/endopeptidase (penicillin-binding protein 4)
MRLLAALLAILAAASAVAQPLPRTVRDALRAAHVPTDAAAIVVQGVDADKPRLAHRAYESVNPASVMKVITSFAALELLGPAFTFHTDVLARGKLDNGVLDGDLVIRGGGDPRLTYERLWQLAHRLRTRGVREIRGDVILDRGYFAPVPYDPASFDREPRRAYNVAPDALLVNFQAIDFRFIPDAETVRVLPEPDLPTVRAASRIRRVSEPCTSYRRNLKYDVEENAGITQVTFSGTYSSECGERTWPLAVMDAQRYFEAAFRWVWAEAGGTIRGRFRMDATPADAFLVLRHESDPLPVLVRDMNKFSNNVMARHLFLALSAQEGAPAQAQASARIVHQWLASRDIDDTALILENGSGLSRDERVSATLVARVLKAAWQSPVMPELAGSFPLLGVDGTLKTHRPGAVGAHLKGGTLTGVQAAAGYVLDAKGRRWIVVMILNHPNANAAGEAIDALVDWVSNGGAR